jgi:hypothetical protein
MSLLRKVGTFKGFKGACQVANHKLRPLVIGERLDVFGFCGDFGLISWLSCLFYCMVREVLYCT